MNRTIVTLVLMGTFSSCIPSGERENDVRSTRERVDALPGSGDPVEQILRAPPSDARLDDALAKAPTLEVVEDAAVRRNPNLKAALERWVGFLERPMQRLVPAYPGFAYRYSSMF